MNEDILYKQYAKSKYITEQIAVISNDMNTRLKQYLSNDQLIEKLSLVLRELNDGEEKTITQLQISGKDYGIMEDDIVHVKADLTDDKNPKFIMWVLNDEFIFGDVDLELAAKKLWMSGQEGNVLTSVGNYIGSLFGVGDASDAGTDEKTLTAVAGAICMIGKEKMIDPLPYFEKLSVEFSKMGKGSITDFLETEFSGNAESVALNTFRLPISHSTSRGINLGALLLDVGLAIATFGMGTAANASAKGVTTGVSAVSKANVATKTTKGATTAVKGGEAITFAHKGSVLASATNSMNKSWQLLSPAVQLARARKLLPVGETVVYGSNAATQAISASYKISKVGKLGVTMTNLNGSGKFTVKLANLAYLDASAITKAQAAANLVKAGTVAAPVVLPAVTTTAAGAKGILSLSPKLLGLLVPNTAKKVVGQLGIASAVSKSESSAPSSGNPAEWLGWYDSLKADPNSYISEVKESSASNLADMIWQLSKGSGIFGNTTDQEELKLALIITSLKPEVAEDVKTAWEKLGDSRSIYSVLDEELGGAFGTDDLVYFAKAWWASCTGDGVGNHPEITAMKEIILKGK